MPDIRELEDELYQPPKNDPSYAKRCLGCNARVYTHSTIDYCPTCWRDKKNEPEPANEVKETDTKANDKFENVPEVSQPLPVFGQGE